MRTRTCNALAAVVAGLLAMSLAGCGDNGGGEGGMTVGLLMPSRTPSRWEHFDKPLIEKRVRELCSDCTIEYANAENDAGSQQQQMTSMIAKEADVVILDPVDPKALRSSVQEAKQAGVPVIAYDRLAEGPISGFVSFDGAEVGRLQATALLKAMGDTADGGRIVMMNGDPASPNSAWFEEGARSVLADKVRIGGSYDNPGYQPKVAHANMSAAMAALGPNRIDGVLAVNDAVAAGVISSLKNARVSPLPPVTGQDADLDGVRRIVKGEQTMTVYKPFEREADTAAAMAIAVGHGEDIDAIATTTVDSPTTHDVPAVLLTPISVTADTIEQTLVKDGVYTVDQICTPKLRPACERTGLTE